MTRCEVARGCALGPCAHMNSRWSLVSLLRSLCKPSVTAQVLTDGSVYESATGNRTCRLSLESMALAVSLSIESSDACLKRFEECWPGDDGESVISDSRQIGDKVSSRLGGDE